MNYICKLLKGRQNTAFTGINHKTRLGFQIILVEFECFLQMRVRDTTHRVSSGSLKAVCLYVSAISNCE